MRSFLFLLVLLVSACLSPAQRFVKTVNSWADLLSLNPNDVHTNAFVVYGTTVGDEQGGIFTYFSNSSEDTNLQTVLKPYSYNGRWIKQAGNFLTNTYVTNLYASNIYTTNLTVVNLISNYVTTNITLETLYVTNLFATNATFYTTNITIRGERVRVYTFDPNQFDATIQINPVVTAINIKDGATVTNLTSSQSLITDGVLAMGAIRETYGATAATNDISTSVSSWVEVTSDSAVPGARVLRLDTGLTQGQLLVIKNAPGGNTFLLPNSSAVVGGGQVNLSGTSWQAAPDESMLLIYDAFFQDWYEIGRFGSGTTAGLVANLTPGYIPYATSTNTLGDSPFYRSSANVIGFGGTTPLLTAYNTTGTTNSIIVAWDISTPPAANSVVLGNTNVSGVYIGKAVRVNGNRIGIGTDALKAAPSPTSAVVIGNNSVPLVPNPLYSVVLGNNAAPVASSLQHFVSVGNLNGSNLLVSNQDTLLGSFAGYYMTNSQQSVLIGYDVATKLTNSINNTIVGAETVRSNTFGRENTIIGYGAMNTPTNIERTVIVGTVDTTRSPVTLVGSVTDSVFIGFKSNNVYNAASGFNNVVSIGAGVLPSGDNTIAIGNTNVASLYLGKVGKVDSDGNVAFGPDALKATTTNANVAIGKNAMYQSTIAKWNVAIGEDALSSVTTSDVRGNIAIGKGALDTKTSGQWDIAIGHESLSALVAGGSGYTVIGTQAGLNATAANASTIIGFNAAKDLTSGGQNTIVGKYAGLSQTTASNNDLFGESAVYLNLAGGNNTIIGNEAFYYVTNISKTVVLGQQKQGGTSDIMTNNIVNSVFVGYKDASITNNVPGLTNVVSIGYNTIATNNNQMVLGNASNTELLLGANRGIYWGSGAPAIIANRGSLYLRTDGGAGTTLYVKEADDGAATGWAAK